MNKSNMNKLISTLKDNSTIVIIITIFLLFFGVAFYTYYYFIKPRIDKIYKPNKEYINNDESKVAELYYFYTEWCPHCKNANPVMEQLKEYLASKNNKINNVEIITHYIDCEKNPEVAESFKVESYPTIKLFYDDNIVEYDAKPQLDNLIEFCESTLS